MGIYNILMIQHNYFIIHIYFVTIRVAYID